MNVPFFMNKDENIQRETEDSRAAFYGQTMVLSSWGSGVGISSGGIGLGGGLASSTAHQEEKLQAIGKLFLTNARLVFIKDFEKAPKLIFSVPLQAIQSVTYQTKMLGICHGVGISYLTGQNVQTACFVGLDKRNKPSAESWVADIVNAVQSKRDLS